MTVTVCMSPLFAVDGRPFRCPVPFPDSGNHTSSPVTAQMPTAKETVEAFRKLLERFGFEETGQGAFATPGSPFGHPAVLAEISGLAALASMPNALDSRAFDLARRTPLIHTEVSMLSKRTAGGESAGVQRFGGSASRPTTKSRENQLVVPAEVKVQAVDLAEGKAAVGLFSRARFEVEVFFHRQVGWRFGSAKAWR